jgi:hypothetical protein
MEYKEKLEKILNTPLVSKQILDKLNDKELLKLTFKMNDCERYQRINKPDLFQEEIDECIETIKSILDNGKSRISGYRDIPKVKEYLKIKQL